MYNAYSHYFGMLQKRGYYPYKDVYKLLVLDFIYCLLYHDYRGQVKRQDYAVFDRALECLYGTSCLIPYQDYLKMGKLKLGEMAEIISRLNNSCDEKLHQKVEENTAKISAMEKEMKKSCGCGKGCEEEEIIISSKK